MHRRWKFLASVSHSTESTGDKAGSVYSAAAETEFFPARRDRRHSGTENGGHSCADRSIFSNHPTEREEDTGGEMAPLRALYRRSNSEGAATRVKTSIRQNWLTGVGEFGWNLLFFFISMICFIFKDFENFQFEIWSFFSTCHPHWDGDT